MYSAILQIFISNKHMTDVGKNKGDGKCHPKKWQKPRNKKIFAAEVAQRSVRK